MDRIKAYIRVKFEDVKWYMGQPIWIDFRSALMWVVVVYLFVWIIFR